MTDEKRQYDVEWCEQQLASFVPKTNRFKVEHSVLQTGAPNFYRRPEIQIEIHFSDKTHIFVTGNDFFEMVSAVRGIFSKPQEPKEKETP